MKKIKCAAALLLTLTLVSLTLVLAQAAPVFAEDMALTITGDGVEHETTVYISDLKGMTGQMSENAYSAWNTWPSKKTYYAEGVPLSELLKLAGLKESATTINVSAAPDARGNVGYNCTFLLKDLLAERYTFEGAKTSVPAIIALKFGESGFDKMDDVDMRLIYGQLASQEQTAAGFVQSVRTITVTCDPVRRLPQPEAQAEILSDGQYSVSLSSGNVNAKIYYTTDGSAPSVNSAMYNISAPNWQPQLNVPFKASGNAQVKAIAVASGFADSDVLSFTPASLGGGLVTFTDVPKDYWAGAEIEALSEKGIISGMGGGLFAPEQTLTRAQFAKMMVLAVNGKEPSPATAGQFSDVTQSAWYAPYVAEGVRLGLFNGFADGSFHPNDAVTREQMLAIAVRALPDGENKAAGGGGAFAADGISPWAKGYVEYAYSGGLIAKEMLGEKDGLLYFDGGKPGVRAEAAYVAYNMMSLM